MPKYFIAENGNRQLVESHARDAAINSYWPRIKGRIQCHAFETIGQFCTIYQHDITKTKAIVIKIT